MDYKYKDSLCKFLVYRNCALEDTIGYEITSEGTRVLQRGWITKDYKSLKEKDKRDKLVKNWTLVAGIITAVATLLTAIFTICKDF